MLAPVESEPAHVGLDRVDVLLLLLDGVRVVEAQVAAAAELLGDAEVQADRLGVPDVEVAVGLGREARDDRLVRGPRARSAATMSRMKSVRSGEAGVWVLMVAEDSTAWALDGPRARRTGHRGPRSKKPLPR